MLVFLQTVVYLGRNFLREGFAIAVADAMEINTTITYLDLWGNSLQEVGGIAIADILKRNTTLTSLNLAFCGIQDSNIRKFEEILSKREDFKP